MKIPETLINLSTDGEIKDFHKDFNYLNILCWNIENGKTCYPTIPNKQPHPLYSNLEGILSGGLPNDVLFFLEFSPVSLLPSLQARLEKLYPFPRYHFYPYNDKCPDLGIGVFSKKPMELIQNTKLDYVPLEHDLPKSEEYRSVWQKNYPDERFFIKPLLHFAIQHHSQMIHLLPIHMVMPWDKFARDRSKTAKEGLKRVCKEMLFGKDNPSLHQLQRMISYMKEQLMLDQLPFAVLGDFNFPKRIGPLRTQHHKLLTGARLLDALKNDSLHSWPAQSHPASKSFPYKIKIDHMYVSAKLKVSGRILPLQGSDHYPIFAQIR